MARYESDHTQFMRRWLEAHPEEAEVQQSGRALWWDKAPREAEQEQRESEARVPRKPYYYDAN
jgi:hypothetical protein